MTNIIIEGELSSPFFFAHLLKMRHTAARRGRVASLLGPGSLSLRRIVVLGQSS